MQLNNHYSTTLNQKPSIETITGSDEGDPNNQNTTKSDFLKMHDANNHTFMSKHAAQSKKEFPPRNKGSNIFLSHVKVKRSSSNSREQSHEGTDEKKNSKTNIRNIELVSHAKEQSGPKRSEYFFTSNSSKNHFLSPASGSLPTKANFGFITDISSVPEQSIEFPRNSSFVRELARQEIESLQLQKYLLMNPIHRKVSVDRQRAERDRPKSLLRANPEEVADDPSVYLKKRELLTKNQTLIDKTQPFVVCFNH